MLGCSALCRQVWSGLAGEGEPATRRSTINWRNHKVLQLTHSIDRQLLQKTRALLVSPPRAHQTLVQTPQHEPAARLNGNSKSQNLAERFGASRRNQFNTGSFANHRKRLGMSPGRSRLSSVNTAIELDLDAASKYKVVTCTILRNFEFIRDVRQIVGQSIRKHI